MANNTENSVPAGDSAHESSQGGRSPFEPYSTMPRECGGIHRYILVITKEDKKKKRTYSTTNVELGDPEMKAWYKANEEEVDDTILCFCKIARAKGLEDGQSMYLDDDEIGVKISRMARNVFVVSIDWLDDDDDETVDESSEDPSD